MLLRNVSDMMQFSYCKAKTLKGFQFKKISVSPGDTVYVMLYPNKTWFMFNTTNEESDKQVTFTEDAKLGIDFEPINT